ncbi:MAG: MoxR family ATPase [Lentisphaerae bacterium]|nr:MoxR family ATPase [Lentisphaerota bacterium]
MQVNAHASEESRLEPLPDDVKAAKRLGEARARVQAELNKVIVGMDPVIDEVMVAIFSAGHGLLEGVPGLAKTLLISCLAKTLSLSFRRIQFTPDLMPSDITGTEILQDDPQTGQRRFVFSKGPVFSNIILADEINRTPPKTQAALLEAMQEKKISAGGEDFRLDKPFFVLATQNPLEQEGTYPLPEAQLDRFMLKILVGYPSEEDEIRIMKTITTRIEPEMNLDAVLRKDEILALQDLVRHVPVADHIFNYVAALVRATRPGGTGAPDFVNQWVSWGASPRACLCLIGGGKARALLHGRFHVAIEDIRALAPSVMRHRIGLNFAAHAEGVSTDDIVKRLLTSIPCEEKLYDAKPKHRATGV